MEDDAWGWIPPSARKVLHVLRIFITYAATVFPFVLLLIWLTSSLASFSGLAGDFETKPWKTFNWHPFCMLLAFSTLYAQAALAYKVLPFSHTLNKIIHMSIQTFAVILATLGFYVIIKFKDVMHNPHFFSLHSWLGLVVYILFCLQFLVGAVAFTLPIFHIDFPPVWMRTWIKYLHVWAGITIYLGGNLVILTGILDRQFLYIQFNEPGTAQYGSESLMVGFISLAVIVAVWLVMTFHAPFRTVVPAKREYYVSISDTDQ